MKAHEDLIVWLRQHPGQHPRRNRLRKGAEALEEVRAVRALERLRLKAAGESSSAELERQVAEVSQVKG